MTEENKTPEIDPIESGTPEGAAEETEAAFEEIKAVQESLDEARAKVEEIKNDNPPISYSEEEVATVAETIELEAQPVEEVAAPEAAAVQAEVESPGQVPPPPPAPSDPSQPYYQAPPQQTYQPQDSQPQPQPQQPYQPPQQPYQQQPNQQQAYQQPPQQQTYYYQQQQYPPQQSVSPKDHVAAGLLGIFLGALGIHKFYLGYNTAGFIMLAVTILGGIVTCSIATWVMWIIGIIEGILYLTKSQGEFEQIYVFNKREWF